MVEALKAKPEEKNRIRERFRLHKQKMSYNDFFEFCVANLGLKLRNWEKDILEEKLDRLGFAFIDFPEYAEFCEEYGFSFGEELPQTHLDDILDQKLNVSYRDYKLTKADYFQACKTILTSEKAALAKCH